MPILIFLSNFLGQPIVVTIAPAQVPKIEFQIPIPTNTGTPTAEPAGCRYLVCKV